MKFYTASPIPWKSSRLLDFDESTCLLEMYLAMKFKKSLIFFESDAKYSIELWSKMEWKLLFQSLDSVGTLGLYGSWMLMTMSSAWCVVWTCVELGAIWSSRTHWGFKLQHIRVATLAHHISLGVSRLTNSNCFLLGCLIRQSQRIVVHIDVYVYGIIVLHPFMICNGRLCWRHWRVPRCLFFSWEGSISHLIVIVRSKSCKNVHPCVVWVKHSW